ncbi:MULTISPECIES: IS701 family transposase [unclassified Tolypothrix]|uniref:IS701 family transposase n=1 Tax=unclassified Tolypothrix TaxID=2649714 RepID=UPI0005EABCDD|nr:MULTISPECIES: IS701 family transposase [unclassified Tolypothrix]BAY95618.1 transposase [Microchaete diplosiphon NIES-3275]EKE97321.1 transposase [Tolypothrix sp. PCC 7601]MBE9088163.1 IS701 family transposase [Tolypothrix sp. LEGE 11397]UYD30604.1 IS701 family transposase [Tolypothrix sp. PCC 7712]UYD38469.1 IS701 family transposase [Tolypothrix sp. PCC 7601]
MVQPRPAAPTVKFVDEYCQWYKSLFSDVRSFEAFKYLHVGCISELKRKTLPEIAKIVGLDNHQGLHHFLTSSPWQVEQFRILRLELILQMLQGKPIILIIDETGDKKKGNKTDYVKRQYIGNLGKTENGIVVVTVYGVFCGMTFPLLFEVYKPRERLKAGDKYRTKPEIAAILMRKLQLMGFKFNLVLADSLYGESETNFISVLDELNLKYIVAIRSNHYVELLPRQRIQYLKWHRFKRVFSNLNSENRFIREIIPGKRGRLRYWQITTDAEELPESSTWYVMSKYPDITPRDVGNFYGLRTWVEYGLKQSKNELGWADYRLTHYPDIEKWWEIVCSAYLMVSLHSEQIFQMPIQSNFKFASHPWWDDGKGWKNILNNLRLIIQPFTLFNLISPWLTVFPIPQLSLGFSKLQSIVYRLTSPIFIFLGHPDFYFSSA